MKFSEILNRLTGVSTPIFGISWNPAKLDVAIARKVITFLEDRRVLYSPGQMEVPASCVQSVIEIRHFLTEQLSDLNSSSELAMSLRAMRLACRKFLDTVGERKDDIITHGFSPGHFASWVFLGALGELRGVFGVQLAKIAAQHKLDIEDELAVILPAADEDSRPRNRSKSIQNSKTVGVKPKQALKKKKSIKSSKKQ